VLSKASSVEYTAYIEAQNNDSSWANQTEDEFFQLSYVTPKCYELKSLELDDRTTLVLSNTRELDRELFYKLVYLI